MVVSLCTDCKKRWMQDVPRMRSAGILAQMIAVFSSIMVQIVVGTLSPAL
jgi:hypothetical protein